MRKRRGEDETMGSVWNKGYLVGIADGPESWSRVACRVREEGMEGVWWGIGGTIEGMFRLCIRSLVEVG